MRSSQAMILGTIAALAAEVPVPQEKEEGGRMTMLQWPKAALSLSHSNGEEDQQAYEKRQQPPIPTATAIYTVPGTWNEHATSKTSRPPKRAKTPVHVAATETTLGIPGIRHEGATSYISWTPPTPSSSEGFPTVLLPVTTSVTAMAAVADTSAIPGVWNERGTNYISWPPSPAPTGNSPDTVAHAAADRAEAAVATDGSLEHVAGGVDNSDDSNTPGTSPANKSVGAILLYVAAAALVVVVGGGIIWQCYLKPRRKRQQWEKHNGTQVRV